MDQISVEDILIRSRNTILDLLHLRGYNTTPYRNLVGPDLVKLMGNPDTLRIEVTHSIQPEKKAIVNYLLKNIKQEISSGKYTKEIISTFEEEEQDPANVEVIVIYMPKNVSEDMESYNKAALEAWNKHKLRIQFFPMTRIVNNPLNHMLQPKFEIIPKEQHDDLKKELYCRSISQFPLIRYHHDMAARCLGLIPGDIVKITRPSYSAGEYISYRTCSP